MQKPTVLVGIREGCRIRTVVLSLILFLAVNLWSATAIAISISMSPLPSGVSPSAQVGEQATLEIHLDTQGTAGIALLSVGVLFDDAILAYRQDLSSATSYLLYNAGKSPYLTPSPTCGGGLGAGGTGGSAGDGTGCSLRVGTTNQVNVDFLATDVLAGAGSATGNSPAGFGPGGLLATLVFDVIATGDGIADLSLSLTSPGNIISGYSAGIYEDFSATLGAGTQYYVVPEPSTALLLGLGLVDMAARRRVWVT